MDQTSIKNNSSPHFWWLMIIFGGTIIALISYICTQRMVCAQKIMEYISFASTLLSITLSVFAILYTYTSNVQIQQQFEKINNAAHGITQTSNDLTKTGSKLDSNLDAILEKLKDINDQQQKIRGQMNNINKQISNSVADMTNIK